jgi:hypothetical protein
MQCDPSISLIKRSTSGEIARTSPGIQKSISRMEDWERFPENCGSELNASFRLRIAFMANARSPEKGIAKAKVRWLPEFVDLIEWY